MNRKVCVIGGGGVRTPLLIHGLLQSQKILQIGELLLFDVDRSRAELMAAMGREIARSFGVDIHLAAVGSLEEAVEGSTFVLSSLRIGGMTARARDERIAIEHGLAGQETTGPGGVAMALRTVPVALAHARVVERLAPQAWFINFTNPAGLITQALNDHTKLRVVGICDTPAELFHRIAHVLGASPAETHCDYAGLNHLGWVRRVLVRGKDVTAELLENDESLRQLYHANLFDPLLIRTLKLIPSEYLFFYYSQRKAHQNQLRAGASRGEELVRLNADLFKQLQSNNPKDGLATYRRYLMQRNASYLRLESEAGSAFHSATNEPDPFETATGYHRIAVDVMSGLVSQEPRTVVVNVRNSGSMEDLAPEDVIEVPCRIGAEGVKPMKVGRLPESVRGLVLAVKEYERTLIRAVIAHSWPLAQLAMLEYPIIAQWEIAEKLRESFSSSDPEFLGYLNLQP
ncbi:MAG: glycosyl hydrolase [Terriglobales bacterium]